MCIGGPADPPKRTAPTGPSRNVSGVIASGAGAAMNFLRGATDVVIVLPSLTTRTGSVLRSSRLGRTKVRLKGMLCFWALPSIDNVRAN